MSKQACGLCGRDPATGWAKVDDTRYCHGDDDEVPTCYMRSQRALLPKDWLAAKWIVDLTGVQADKGHSEETCVRCGWRMGSPPLNCQNDDTPHVFPSQLAGVQAEEQT